MSDAEKLVDTEIKYPAEPLILRPPVGDEVFKVKLVKRYSSESHGSCRPRSVAFRVLLLCVTLAAIAGGVLILFAIHHSNSWPWAQHRRSFSGFCRAITPYPGIDVGEQYMYEPKAITITHGPVAGFPSVSIFHLLNDAMTVMRTQGTCYIYPMSPEIVEAVPTDESVIERIRETEEMREFKSTFGQRVFMVSPDSGERVQINHPAAAANCSDVPIFRLVEMVLSQAAVQLDPTSEAAMSPAVCPKDCPAGESRDSFGVARQVCRCPPKEDLLPNNLLKDTPVLPPLAPFPSEGIANDELPPIVDDFVNEDGGDDEDDDDVDFMNEPFGSSLSEAGAWLPMDDGEVQRSRRAAAETMHNMEAPIKVPADCHVVDKVLEGAVPSARGHRIPLMTIVKC